MKHLILSLIFGFLAISCNRSDDPPANPVAQLPPATTTGANTIGCLVNGEVFLPHQNNPTGPSSTHCHYQFVNNEWNLGISFSNDSTNPLRSVGIFSINNDLQQGSTYQLKQNTGNPNLYGTYGAGGSSAYFTNDLNSGELKITRLDKINNIISGTFWFDAINTAGQKVQIREGRFDMHYIP